MFELNVGTTPCQLTHKDYKELALQTEGYAASYRGCADITG
jgi:vacuolar protein-sorting-associated protein 4